VPPLHRNGLVRESADQIIVEHMPVTPAVAQQGQRLHAGDAEGPAFEVAAAVEFAKPAPKHQDRLLEHLRGIFTSLEHGPNKGAQRGLVFRVKAEEVIVAGLVGNGHRVFSNYFQKVGSFAEKNLVRSRSLKKKESIISAIN